MPRHLPRRPSDHKFSSLNCRTNLRENPTFGRQTRAQTDGLLRQADASLPFLFQVRRDAGSRAGRAHERVQKVRRVGGRNRRHTSRAGDGDRIARAGSETTTTTTAATTRTRTLTATNMTTVTTRTTVARARWVKDITVAAAAADDAAGKGGDCRAV